MFDLQQILQFFSELAHQPELVYLAVIVILTASSFGLPMPEEVTLIAAGTIAYFSVHPPEGSVATGSLVDPWILAGVCFVAVFGSDYLVYWLGKKSRGRIGKIAFFARMMQTSAYQKTEQLVKVRGHWMAGVFRFTPGLRFPGHFCCGVLGVPGWKFTAIDGSAALLTVPTQVLLVAYYGDRILESFKQFKIAVAVVLGLIILYFVGRHYYRKLMEN